MKHHYLILILSLCLPLVSCQDESQTVDITSKRRLTDYDEQSDSFDFISPKDWRRVPATRFRELNFKFGQDGEAYFSRANGSLLENTNRWLKQYGQEPVTVLKSFPLVDFAGGQGYLIEADGDFRGGMGAASRSDWGLIGVIASVGESTIVTVKMVGPKEEVKAQKDNFLSFCESIKGR